MPTISPEPWEGAGQPMAGHHGSDRAQTNSQDPDHNPDAYKHDLHDPSSPTAIFNPYYTGRPRTPASASKHASIDRQEIIRKIKSRDSRPSSPELERPSSTSGRRWWRGAAEVESKQGTEQEAQPQSPVHHNLDAQAIGMDIGRPRSALHRGDFREKAGTPSAFSRLDGAPSEPSLPSLSTSPVAPWHPDFPNAAFRQGRRENSYRPPSPPGLSAWRPPRQRAVSNASLAASFIYKPPTSPLVQSSRPDTPEPGARRNSRSPDKSRRHTFSPRSLQRYQSALEYPASARSNVQKQPPSLRSEKTFPYQAHQPRRSLNSFGSLPQTPVFASRRPSFSDSPLHHAPMVGSYEESILRGRMSTTPSKPLNFVAQIGVLGRGTCKPQLRCPPHVTVPFPAVFYSYSTGTRAAADQPSPYVGLVDLENTLPAYEPSPEKRRSRLDAVLSPEGSRASSRTREDGSASDAQVRRRRRQKQKRRSRSPKAPPGGSYRIPQQGQLQVVIKNPNKTAVKLFLIPYDLSDMEPGQKTFIRQRSYSAGPIIDMPLSSRKNLGTDRPEASLSHSDDPQERPMLRYLVHLHICCPSKGRYFLYKSMRLVFANRVPDGKERLRNEIQLPEPRYSTYKPGRDSTVGLSGSMTANDTTLRRRSAFNPSMSPLEQHEARGVWDTPWPALQSHPYRTAARSLPSSEVPDARHNPSIDSHQPPSYGIGLFRTDRATNIADPNNMDIDEDGRNPSPLDLSPLTSGSTMPRAHPSRRSPSSSQKSPPPGFSHHSPNPPTTITNIDDPFISQADPPYPSNMAPATSVAAPSPTPQPLRSTTAFPSTNQRSPNIDPIPSPSTHHNINTMPSTSPPTSSSSSSSATSMTNAHRNESLLSKRLRDLAFQHQHQRGGE